MTSAAHHWEVHPTGASGVWVLRCPGDPPWTQAAVVYHYERSDKWLCQRCQRPDCEHVKLVQAGWPIITPARATPEDSDYAQE